MIDGTADSLLNHLTDQKSAMQRSVTEIAEMESPSSDADAQGPVLEWLTAMVKDLDWVSHRFPGSRSGGQLLAMPRDADPARPRQLLLGHCDTVWPRGTLDTMPVRVDGDRLFGPGVFDMKGGLVQSLFALRSLHRLNVECPVTPILFVNSDEEIGSPESSERIKRLSRCVDRALVMEPALGEFGKIKTRRKGVGRFQVEVSGRAAHAGLDPELGINAIVAIASVVERLHQMNDPDAGTSVNVGVISGGVQPNVVAAKSQILVDVRVPTADDADRVDAMIRQLQPGLPGAHIEITGGFSRPPLEQTPGNLEFWQRAITAADSLGLELDQAFAGGGSDGNFTSQNTPTLDGLGAVGGGAHAVDEHLCLSHMPRRAALLACLIRQGPMGDEATAQWRAKQYHGSEFDLSSDAG